jgi:hypothetical protein
VISGGGAVTWPAPARRRALAVRRRLRVGEKERRRRESRPGAARGHHTPCTEIGRGPRSARAAPAAFPRDDDPLGDHRRALHETPTGSVTCYPSEATIWRYAASGNAFSVRVRTAPSPLSTSMNRAATASSGVS